MSGCSIAQANGWLIALCVLLAVLAFLLLVRVQRLEGEPRPTLRDYFAAKAMQAAITHHIPEDAAQLRFAADNCYAIADAMLKARSL